VGHDLPFSPINRALVAVVEMSIPSQYPIDRSLVTTLFLRKVLPF
jgi:hypothetical protein